MSKVFCRSSPATSVHCFRRCCATPGFCRRRWRGAFRRLSFGGQVLRQRDCLGQLRQPWLSPGGKGGATSREFSVIERCSHDADKLLGEMAECTTLHLVWVRPGSTLVYGRHIPEGELLEGVYLDDVLIAKQCSVGYDICLDGSLRDQDQGCGGCLQGGRFATSGAQGFQTSDSFKVWGGDIDGIRGKVGAPVSVRRQVDARVQHHSSKLVLRLAASPLQVSCLGA